MSGINKVILIGNVGNAEIRSTQSGECIANLSLATSEKYTDKSGQAVNNTEWHKITLFRRQAEIVRDYVQKGDKIYIEGKIKTEKYTDKQGVEKYTTKIVAREIQMLGSKHDNGAAPPPAREQPRTSNDSRNHSKPQAAPPPFVDELDDEIPF